ncbi:cellulose binding domain-containing protein [Micromonospora lutea]|uniref:CBM2 domain-containing protein n=1 Tax=Micromonospora lutea TaxID=419825 RepID=A0ABQ4J1R3_9ACTN|nr:cellulose binding domain-containing protein [Micromonospora lutea]GIJ24074.1 hypothetical protein Vlu01_46980 [Micromonospora lutea]
MSVRPSGDANDDATGDQYGDGNRAATGDQYDDAVGDRNGDVVGDAGTVGGHALPRMIASAPWVMVLVGVAVLAVLLVVALLSFRGPEQPVAWSPGPPITLPTAAGESAESASTAHSTTTGPSVPATPPLSVPPSASVTPSGSPASSATSARPTGPSRSGAPGQPETYWSPSASAPAGSTDGGGTVTVSYRVQGSGADYFEAQMVVRNSSGQSNDWKVELRFNGGVTGVRASSGPGVAVTIRGSGWYLLSGTGQLAAGAQQSVQLRFTRTGGGEYPAQCTVNGTSCGIG